MTKKQMQARIAELEATVQTLTTAINAMRTPIYVGPVPAQPTVNPIPHTPYMWGPGTIGGRQAQCNMGHQEG